jgi:hypothetical protein
VSKMFRKVLADSHVAATSIAVLLLKALESGVQTLEHPFYRAVSFLITSVAIRGIPYGTGTFTFFDWIMPFGYLMDSITTLGAAWLVSRWVYGVGPFRSLSKCLAGFTRRSRV